MPERIVIISDTHFGRSRACAHSAEALRPLWRELPGNAESMRASHFIINGDVAEVHHPTHWSQAAREVMQLFDLCEADDVPLTLLSGNHDPYLTDRRHLLLANRSILITHGDAIHPAIAPWSPAARRIRAVFDEAMATVEPEKSHDLETRLNVAQHAAHAEFQEWDELKRQAKRSTIWRMLVRPWAIAQVLWYWHAFPKMAATFAETHAPETRVMILGHTHRPGMWRIDGRIIINTGSFGFPGRPCAVLLEEHKLSVWRVILKNKKYHFAQKAVERFELSNV